MITQERLKQLVYYDERTGNFTFKVNKGIRKVGMVAGSAVGGGYWRIRLDGREYKAHRLAWFYVHGKWPVQDLDHINLNKRDNRISNLRLATETENNANQSLTSRNTSGFKGVTWHAKCQKWQASVKVKGRNRYLGLFDRAEDAHSAYVQAAQEAFGEFARAA